MVSVRLGVLLRVDLEPMRKSSVLLLLSLRKFFCIQDFKSVRQDSMWVRGGLWRDLVLR